MTDIQRGTLSAKPIMANLELVNFPGLRIYEILRLNWRYGLRMDRVEGKMMSAVLRDPARCKDTLHIPVDLQCRLQKYDKVGWLPDLRQRPRDDLVLNDRLSADPKKNLLGILSSLSDGRALCHCDFHAGNVFFDGTKYTGKNVRQWLTVYAGPVGTGA